MRFKAARVVPLFASPSTSHMIAIFINVNHLERTKLLIYRQTIHKLGAKTEQMSVKFRI